FPPPRQSWATLSFSREPMTAPALCPMWGFMWATGRCSIVVLPSNTQISIQAAGRHISTPSGACEPEERSPCMNKIDKLDKELEKAREKAAEWQAKIRELEKQKQEEENSQIVQAVRSLKLTPAELMAFLNDPKNSLAASGHNGPKPEAPEKEDTAHEEN